MGILDRFLGRNEPTEPVVVRSVTDTSGFFLSNPSAVAPALNSTSAFETSAIMAAVSAITDDIAKLPINLIKVSKVNGLERRERITEHPLLDLLNHKPNNWQTPFEFKESMLMGALLGTGAVAVKNQFRDTSGKLSGFPTELIPILPGSFTVDQMSDNSMQFKVNQTLKDTRVYTSDEVVFLRGISANNYTGIRILDLARKAVGIASSLENQQLQLAATGGRPSGILSTSEPLSPEKKAATKAQWQAAYGPGGSGGVAVLDSGASYETISMSAVDSQFVENRRLQIEEIARFFKVQPLFLGHNAGVNVDGVDAAMRLHVTKTLMPWISRFEEALRLSLLPDMPGYYFQIDTRELMRGDLKAMSESYTKLMGVGGSGGILSLNEIRYEFDQDLIDEDWAKVPSKGGYAEVAGIVKTDGSVQRVEGPESNKE